MKNRTYSKIKSCKQAIMLVLIGCFSINSFSQNILFNNGAKVYVDPAAIVKVYGGFQNDNALGTLNVFENNGTMTIASVPGNLGNVHLTANSTLKGNGKYLVEQDWTNDAIFTCDTSTVNFMGNLQEFITSTNHTVTTFHHLILSGVGTTNDRKKTLKYVNAKINISGTLTLNDRELETDTNTMFVLNPLVSCVTNSIVPGNEGFVSSNFKLGGSGYLSRATNASSAYNFPIGSSVSGIRYRPVVLTPSSATTNTYVARMGYYTATTDGFNLASLDTSMCSVNLLFYHEIQRTAGSAIANIGISFDHNIDGYWDGMAKWASPVGARWNNMGAVTSSSGIPYNYVKKANWADFSFSPYILARIKPVPPVLTCSSICSNTSGNVFSATAADTTFTWTTPTGTTITSGQGTDSIIVNWGTTSGTVTVTVSDIPGCSSSPASCTVGLNGSPVAKFGSSTLENHFYNFKDSSTGAPTSWSWDFGDGQTSSSQNPTHVYLSCGETRVCLTVAKGGCSDSACTIIEVNELAVIPNVFSPDGDGVNDVFFINNICLKDFDLEIFNRWGMKIFETTLSGAGWDGFTASGSISPEGTYYYIFKGSSIISGKNYSTKGFVTLVRKK